MQNIIKYNYRALECSINVMVSSIKCFVKTYGDKIDEPDTCFVRFNKQVAPTVIVGTPESIPSQYFMKDVKWREQVCSALVVMNGEVWFYVSDEYQEEPIIFDANDHQHWYKLTYDEYSVHTHNVFRLGYTLSEYYDEVLPAFTHQRRDELSAQVSAWCSDNFCDFYDAADCAARFKNSQKYLPLTDDGFVGIIYPDEWKRIGQYDIANVAVTPYTFTFISDEGDEFPHTDVYAVFVR